MAGLVDVKPGCDSNQLVALLRGGEIEALDRVTRCYGERLLRVGRRYCASEADAEDAVQDALLAAGEHQGAFRGEGSVEGWIVRMVVNACHRMRRGQKNDPALHVPDGADVLVTLEDSPEVATQRGQLAEAIGQALLELSPTDRSIVLLAEAEGWTGPEIAEAVGLKPGAVRTRLSRARATLRSRLEALQTALPSDA